MLKDLDCKHCRLPIYFHNYHQGGGWTWRTLLDMRQKHGEDVKVCPGYKPKRNKYGFGNFSQRVDD